MAQSKTPRGAKAMRAQRQAIVGFGRMALQSNDLGKILHEACRLTGEALGTDLAKVMELQDDGRHLLVVAGVGWRKGIVGRETVPALSQSSEGYALRTGVPAVSDDIEAEQRFDYAEFLKTHDVHAMVNVVIPGPEGMPPYGLLQVDSTSPREFSESDIEFLQGYANLVGAAIERHRYQARLAESLEVQERLHAELQHRINNNLAVMASLLELKARRTAHPVVKQEIAGLIAQVHVLKEIYKKLHASGEVREIDLGGYLGSVCNGLVSFSSNDEAPVRVDTRAEPVTVSPEVAVPLGLVANEFVTNSLKHRGKTKELVILLEIGQKAHVLKLKLKDNGPGLGKAAKRQEEEEGTGSGIVLIEGLLRQLGATWEWRGTKGTALLVDIKLSTTAVHRKQKS